MGCSFERQKSIIITNAWMQTKQNEFYNGSIKSWLQDNDIEMHSTQNEGKLEH